MAGSTIQYSGLQNTHRVGVQGEHTGQGTTLNRKEFFTYGWEYLPIKGTPLQEHVTSRSSIL